MLFLRSLDCLLLSSAQRKGMILSSKSRDMIMYSREDGQLHLLDTNARHINSVRGTSCGVPWFKGARAPVLRAFTIMR